MGIEELEPVAEEQAAPEPVRRPRRTRLAAEPPPLQYVALFGLNYGCTEQAPDGTRIEAGEDVPESVIQAAPWLLTSGHVRPKKEAAIG